MATIRRRTRHGGYEARWYGPDGRQQSKTFARVQDAKNHVRRMEGDRVSGTYINPRLAATRLCEIAEEWYATNPGNKVNTRLGYRAIMNKHVFPELGSLPVGRLSKATIRGFVQGLSNKNAPGTVRNVFRNVLKPVLDYAVDAGYILQNPAQGVKLPRSLRAEMLFLTAEQVARLAAAIDETFGILVLFTSYTGLRAGEIGALRIKNLDLLRARVTVAESVSPVKGKGLVYGPTKTYAIRTLTFPRVLVDPLAAYIAPRAKDPNRLVFVSETGEALRHNNFYWRFFKPAVKRAFAEEPHLLGLRFHDLRHTAASLLINPPINANPKIIQERLGHSSIQVTFDRYGHLFSGLDEDLGSALDDLFRSTKAALCVRAE